MKSYEEIVKQLEMDHQNKSLLESFIQQGLNIDQRDESGWTLLTLALKLKLVNAAKCLIQSNASLNQTNQRTETPLFLASYHGLTNIIQQMIDKKVDVNVATEMGDSPLIAAIANKHRDAARLLMQSGANVTHSPKSGDTALHWVAKKGLADICVLILQNGGHCIINTKNKKGVVPLMIALLEKQLEIAHTLIKEGADVQVSDNNGVSIFICACRAIKKEFPATALHPKEVEVPKNLYENNLREILALIIKQVKNIDLNYKENPDNEAPLLIALKHHFFSIAELLIDSGANVNESDWQGYTPLDFAEGKHIIDLLFDAGANVNFKHKDGTTPLHSAVNNNGRQEVISYLCNGGTDSLNDDDNKDHCSPYQAAIRAATSILINFPNKYIKIDISTLLDHAKVLIKAGAFLNQGKIDILETLRKPLLNLPRSIETHLTLHVLEELGRFVFNYMIITLVDCLNERIIRDLSNIIEKEYLETIRESDLESFLEWGLGFPNFPQKITDIVTGYSLELADCLKLIPYDISMTRNPKLLETITLRNITVAVKLIIENYSKELSDCATTVGYIRKDQDLITLKINHAKIMQEVLITRLEIYYQYRSIRYFAPYINTLFHQLEPPHKEPQASYPSYNDIPKNPLPDELNLLVLEYCDVPKSPPIPKNVDTKQDANTKQDALLDKPPIVNQPLALCPETLNGDLLKLRYYQVNRWFDAVKLENVIKHKKIRCLLDYSDVDMKETKQNQGNLKSALELEKNQDKPIDQIVFMLQNAKTLPLSNKTDAKPKSMT